MVMIRCPGCGHSALDVASTCPHCGYILLQNPLETGDASPLVGCSRCGKHIDRDVAVCPYCGHHVRRVRVVRRTTVAVVVTAAVAIGIVAALRSGIVRFPTRSATPAPAATVPPAVAQPEPAVPLEAAPIRAAPPVPPDTTPSRTGRAPAPDRPGPTAGAPPANATARWTADWANVRETRSADAAVVRVLRPGLQVTVADQRNGWWAVFVEGTQLGYIANSVLTTTPPGP